MPEKYCQTLYDNLREKIAETSQPLLNSGINSLEQYKYISGMKKGLEAGLFIAQETYKKLYDMQFLNEVERGEEYERRRKDSD